VVGVGWLVLGLGVAACVETGARNDEGSTDSDSDSSGAGGSRERGALAADVALPSDRPSTDTEWSTELPSGPNGPIPFIVVDQFGYRTTSTKIAVIRDPRTGYDSDESFTPGSEYAVVDSESGETVYTGAPAAWNGGAEDPVSGDVVYWFDFSSVTTPGEYTVRDVEQNLRSVTFRIDDAVYRGVLGHAVRSFYYQRAGQEKTVEHAGAAYADAASHLGPEQDGEAHSWLAQDDPSTARDLRGGWYDAGDFNKYTAWTASYVILLLRAYEASPTAFTDETRIPESGNGVPDVLDEALWGLAWLGRMQLEDGSLLCVQGLDGASPPSAATGPSYYGPPTTNASLRGAAAFAYAALILGDRSETELQALAAEYDERAARAWDWAAANPTVTYYNNNDGRQPGSAGLAAGQQEVNDDGRLRSRVEAAVYLFAQTGDTAYRDIVDENAATLVPSWGPDQWQAEEQELLLWYSALPEATESVATEIRTRFVTQMTSSEGQYAAAVAERDAYRSHLQDYVWGSNQSKAAQGRLYQLLEQYGDDAPLGADAVAAAEGFVHYLHGVNPLGLAYLTNMQIAGAEHSARTLYHTWFAHGSAWWDEVTASTPGPAPGLLVGGPNPRFSLDSCCSDESYCYGAAEYSYCFESWQPPLDQPPLKSYLQFNEGWPANSWAVTENSCGYQAKYVLLLARYAL
jgi:endoglucanase